MTRMSFVEAGRTALAEEMRRDPAVWVLGEDVAHGGLYGQYNGLAKEFGKLRLISTPISEATIMGAGLGAALVGTRPVIEMRMTDFALCAIDELVNQIAKVRYMFGGQARASLVVRMPHGMVRNSAAQHSQCLEAWFAHVPGLVVVAPGTPADAAGLLKAAIRSDDPVVFLEPKALWQQEGEVPEDTEPIPFGTARIARKGGDATLVTWSAALGPALQAAEEAAAEGMAVEVLDLRSIWPWDAEAVVESVRRSRRLLVVHEAVTAGGFGAEVLATVAERLAGESALRLRRLGAPRAPVPFSPRLEDAIRVDAPAVLDALRSLCAD